MIYLDHNATTQPTPEVVEAVREAVAELWPNPSSIHRLGQAARQRIELARKHLASLIGARPRTITLTGSGTESIDLAIRGHLLARGLIGARSVERRGRVAIVISPIEHIAIRDLAKALEREEGVEVYEAALDATRRVDPASVQSLLNAHPHIAMVSVQWANNETGAIQPAPEIARLCRARGVTFHCDATQWVGKLAARVVDAESATDAADPSAISADLLTFSPHKFHGPKGVGVLYARPGVRTAPLIHGEQELGRRGGTENVPGILGAGVAAQQAMAWLDEPGNVDRGRAIRDRLEQAVLAAAHAAGGQAQINVPDEPRLWNTTSIGFRDLEAEGLLLLLSERGVCCSAGAACSSGSLEASAVIKAMKIPTEFAHGTLRLSISRHTTESEVDQAAAIVGECVARLRKSWLPQGSGPHPH